MQCVICVGASTLFSSPQDKNEVWQTRRKITARLGCWTQPPLVIQDGAGWTAPNEGGSFASAVARTWLPSKRSNKEVNSVLSLRHVHSSPEGLTQQRTFIIKTKCLRGGIMYKRLYVGLCQCFPTSGSAPISGFARAFHIICQTLIFSCNVNWYFYGLLFHCFKRKLFAQCFHMQALWINWNMGK